MEMLWFFSLKLWGGKRSSLCFKSFGLSYLESESTRCSFFACSPATQMCRLGFQQRNISASVAWVGRTCCVCFAPRIPACHQRPHAVVEVICQSCFVLCKWNEVNLWQALVWRWHFLSFQHHSWFLGGERLRVWHVFPTLFFSYFFILNRVMPPRFSLFHKHKFLEAHLNNTCSLSLAFYYSSASWGSWASRASDSSLCSWFKLLKTNKIPAASGFSWRLF